MKFVNAVVRVRSLVVLSKGTYGFMTFTKNDIALQQET